MWWRACRRHARAAQWASAMLPAIVAGGPGFAAAAEAGALPETVHVRQDPFDRLRKLDAHRIASSASSLPALRTCNADEREASVHALLLAGPSSASEDLGTGPFELIDPRYRGQLDSTLRFGCGFAQFAVQRQVAAHGDFWSSDGSALGWQLGEHWQVAVGRISRQWGPGWDGSLILGSAARPIDSVSIEVRSGSLADSKYWHWLGEVQFSGFVGKLESQRNDYNSPRLYGARVVIRPIPSLEIGASRTGQLGGEGRSESLRTYLQAFLGRDNHVDANGDGGSQPGNQLGGFDLRWSLAQWLPGIALYGQMIGEDESGRLPSKYMYLAGAEWRHAHGLVFAEWTDTVAGSPGVAYNHHVYTDGYRYRGSPLGHWADGDSQLWAFGALMPSLFGGEALAVLRVGKLNRSGVNPTWPTADLVGGSLQWRTMIGPSLRLSVAVDAQRLSGDFDDAVSRRSLDARLQVEGWWP